jgi:drug/metabolite transporter (DMT)-like permease
LSPVHLGSLLVLVSAFCFSAMSFFALRAYAADITVSTLLFLRFALTALCLFGVMAVRGDRLRLNWRQTAGVAVLGLCYMLQSTCFFQSVRYISPALTTLILYSYPMLVALLSVVVDREQLTRRTIGALLLSVIGAAFIVGAGGPLNSTGALLALGAAVIYSCYIVIGNRVIRQLPPLTATAHVAWWASLTFLLTGLAGRSLDFGFPVTAWPAVIGLALISTVLAMVAFFAGLERIGSTRASILSTAEPLLTAVLSAVILQQPLTLVQGVGGLAIVTGGLLAVLPQPAKRRAVAASTGA